MEYQLYVNDDGQAQIDISDEQRAIARWLMEDVRQHNDLVRALISAIEVGKDWQHKSKQFLVQLSDQELSCEPLVEAQLSEEAEALEYQAWQEGGGCGSEDLLPLLNDWLDYNPDQHPLL